MKRILLLSCLIALFNMAQGQITVPAPSPAGTAYSKVGLTDVNIDYSRPKMKGRKIYGEGSEYLVPFGAMWRTGANFGTKVSFSTSVTVGDGSLEAGEYLLLTVPGKSAWDVMFYTDVAMGGNLAAFKEEHVAAKVRVTPQVLSPSVETLTFNISDISEDNTKAAIELTWEGTRVAIPFSVDFDSEVMSQIEKHTQVDPQNYIAAANYYFSTGKDAKQALEWITMYFASNENYENQFWNLHLMAQIQKAAGDVKGAKATAEKSLAKAKSNQGGDFGYIKRNEDFLATLK